MNTYLVIFSRTSLLVLVHMKIKYYGICEKGKILSKSKVYDFCGYMAETNIKFKSIFLWLRNNIFKTVYDFVP